MQPLQAGAALRLDSINAMRPAWRTLTETSELPSTQFEWTLSALDDPSHHVRPYVAYASSGGSLHAILPLMVRTELGVEHYHYISPDYGVPNDIPHSDETALKALLEHLLKKGRPIILPRLLESSPALGVIRSLTQERRVYLLSEPAEPAIAVDVATFPLQDRAQNAARVSILAASYGLAGGPNDVIFQFASPSIEQVMSLYHESLQLDGEAGDPEAGHRTSRSTINDRVFLRTHAFHGVQRGEMRFSSVRLAGRLLAMQVYQVRRQTAWLLRASHMERFRKAIVGTLLLGETIRKLQAEGVTRIIMPAGEQMPELPHCEKIPMVNLKLYPWGSRSLTALMLQRAGGISGRLLRRRRTQATGG